MKTVSYLGRTPEAVIFCSALIFLVCPISSLAQKKGGLSKSPTIAVADERDISGMYSFLKEGEFVQITVENQPAPSGSKQKSERSAKVTGFISRFGDGDSDKGEFLDHFFSRGSLTGNKLTFATKQIHGVWFEFTGMIERGPGNSRADDGYYIVNGTLTQNSVTHENKTLSRSREIAMKLFPDMNDDPQTAKR